MEHPNVNNLDHSTWKFLTWGDNGTAFCSPFFGVHPTPAVDTSTCCLCNHGLRYVMVFKDVDGELYATGENCAEFIESKMPNAEFQFLRKIRSAKKVTTKQGVRVVLKIKPLPSGFWDMWKKWKQTGEKPSWLSLSPYQPLSRVTGKPEGDKQWSVSIWGEDSSDIALYYRNWLELNQ